MAILQQQGGTRNKPISAKLAAVLNAAAEAAGVDVHVFSGGQAAKGEKGPRTGSTRHDHGNAADLSLWQNGKMLREDNPADLKVIQSFIRESVKNGATGIGGGAGYMGIGRLHVGFGRSELPKAGLTLWGPGETTKTAPKWLTDAAKDALPLSGKDRSPTPIADIPNVPGEAAASAGPRSLRKGMRDNGPTGPIHDLQRELTRQGFKPGKIDGVFGPRTAAAQQRADNASTQDITSARNMPGGPGNAGGSITPDANPLDIAFGRAPGPSFDGAQMGAPPPYGIGQVSPFPAARPDMGVTGFPAAPGGPGVGVPEQPLVARQDVNRFDTEAMAPSVAPGGPTSVATSSIGPDPIYGDDAVLAATRRASDAGGDLNRAQLELTNAESGLWHAFEGNPALANAYNQGGPQQWSSLQQPYGGVSYANELQKLREQYGLKPEDHVGPGEQPAAPPTAQEVAATKALMQSAAAGNYDYGKYGPSVPAYARGTMGDSPSAAPSVAQQQDYPDDSPGRIISHFGGVDWFGGTDPVAAKSSLPPPAAPDTSYQGYIPAGYSYGRQDPSTLGYSGNDDVRGWMGGDTLARSAPPPQPYAYSDWVDPKLTFTDPSFSMYPRPRVDTQPETQSFHSRFPQNASASDELGGWRAPITPPSPAMGRPVYNVIGNTMGIPQDVGDMTKHQGMFSDLPDRFSAPGYYPTWPGSKGPTEVAGSDTLRGNAGGDRFASTFSPSAPYLAGGLKKADFGPMGGEPYDKSSSGIDGMTFLPNGSPLANPLVSYNGVPGGSPFPTPPPISLAGPAPQQITPSGVTGGASPNGSLSSPLGYGSGSSGGVGMSPGGYSFAGMTQWGTPQYFTGSSYSNSPFTPSGYKAPDFNPVSGGASYAWNPTDRTYINSFGQKMSMD